MEKAVKTQKERGAVMKIKLLFTCIAHILINEISLTDLLVFELFSFRPSSLLDALKMDMS
ncbi:MAG: hypothetical protein DHS20C07_06120 [Methyloligella sp.]|nr:MAG: hypothetical protein DHS20C07_06120 [Methyloligella sp.]